VLYDLKIAIFSGVIVLSIGILPEVVIGQEPLSNVVCGILDITNLSIASKPSGTIDVLGIISNNNSTLTYEDVAVVGEFYDSKDKLVGIESGSAEFSTLGPADRSPFKIKTYVSNQTLDHYTVSCRSSEGRFSVELP
jgi:hypothetical protein